MRRYLAERQAYLKMVRLNFQVPIFVLQNDRHLIRESFVQMGRNGNSGRLCFESNIEMMVARKAVKRNIAQHTTHNGAQCLLHNVVIGNHAVEMLFTHWRLVDRREVEIKILVAAKSTCQARDYAYSDAHALRDH